MMLRTLNQQEASEALLDKQISINDSEMPEEGIEEHPPENPNIGVSRSSFPANVRLRQLQDAKKMLAKKQRLVPRSAFFLMYVLSALFGPLGILLFVKPQIFFPENFKAWQQGFTDYNMVNITNSTFACKDFCTAIVNDTRTQWLNVSMQNFDYECYKNTDFSYGSDSSFDKSACVKSAQFMQTLGYPECAEGVRQNICTVSALQTNTQFGFYVSGSALLIASAIITLLVTLRFSDSNKNKKSSSVGLILDNRERDELTQLIQQSFAVRFPREAVPNFDDLTISYDTSIQATELKIHRALEWESQLTHRRNIIRNTLFAVITAKATERQNAVVASEEDENKQNNKPENKSTSSSSSVSLTLFNRDVFNPIEKQSLIDMTSEHRTEVDQVLRFAGYYE